MTPAGRRARALWTAAAVAILAAAALAASPAPAAAPAARPSADWPQWRGPARNDVSPESSGYPAGWPPAALWKMNVGKGCTSPVLAGGRLYVMGFHGAERGRGTDTVFCLDARTGAAVWKQSYPSRYFSRLATGDENAYGGPSSTPTFDATTGRLYTLGIDGDLVCWDGRRGGARVWAINLHDTYKPARRPDVGRGTRDYGFPGSPVVLGDVVLVEVGDDDGTVMAFDKATGRRRWRSEAGGFAGHSGGPVLFTVGGTPCLATLALTKVIVMRLDAGHEGRTLAEFPWTTDFANNIPTPTAWPDHLVLTSAYNQSRTALLRVAPGGIREVWTTRDHTGVCSPVAYKGRLFMTAGPLKCLDAATGRRLWSGGQFGDGSCLVAAGDGRLIVFGNGRLVLFDTAADAYRELAAVENLSRATCYPHVALAGGLIAVKDMEGNLVCLDTARRATSKGAEARPASRAANPAGGAAPGKPGG
ncbi:MAG: PQQ-binding-like beta-propeller repeat protein [Acidobacteria bacterium]|nr:PQQ-binding-like beta-propeller repeat protein [Acidobacteriota bacterium]